jgi:hypothetical protein
MGLEIDSGDTGLNHWGVRGVIRCSWLSRGRSALEGCAGCCLRRDDSVDDLRLTAQRGIIGVRDAAVAIVSIVPLRRPTGTVVWIA